MMMLRAAWFAECSAVLKMKLIVQRRWSVMVMATMVMIWSGYNDKLAAGETSKVRT